MELLCERHRPLPPLVLLCTPLLPRQGTLQGVCAPIVFRPLPSRASKHLFLRLRQRSQDGLQVKYIWINFSFVLGEVLFLVVTGSGCGAVLSVSTMCHWSNCCSAATVRTPSRNSGKNSSRRQEAVCGRARLVSELPTRAKQNLFAEEGSNWAQIAATTFMKKTVTLRACTWVKCGQSREHVPCQHLPVKLSTLSFTLARGKITDLSISTQQKNLLTEGSPLSLLCGAFCCCLRCCRCPSCAASLTV